MKNYDDSEMNIMDYPIGALIYIDFKEGENNVKLLCRTSHKIVYKMGKWYRQCEIKENYKYSHVWVSNRDLEF